MNYDFHITAIGASAGGLQSIKTFFPKVDPDAPVAYVVILHSQRSAESHLANIISRVTPMPVIEVETGILIEPGKIYVSRPSSHLEIVNGIFKLTERPESEKINRTINHFFISVARDAKEKVIGVIMSGTGSDGTEGFHAIEAANGITITQDPNTAQFDGMPLTSIQYDHPSYILNPLEMPTVIAQIASK